MGEPQYPDCCCDKTPVKDFTVACQDSTLDVGNLGNFSLFGQCPNVGETAVAAFTKVVCFDLEPGEVLNTFTVTAQINVTNNDVCGLKVRGRLIPGTTYLDPCLNCSFTVTEASESAITLDVGCTQLMSFTFVLNDPSFATCCKLGFAFQLMVDCCDGIGLTECGTEIVSGSFSKTIASGLDVDDTWHPFSGGTGLSLTACTGRICTTGTYNGRYTFSFTNNTALCLEILLRVTNIIQPSPCKYWRVRPSDGENCNTLRELGIGGPGGAFAFVCFAGSGTLTSDLRVVLASIVGCCDASTLSFDFEYKIRCVDALDCGVCGTRLAGCGSCPLCSPPGP